MPTRAYKLWLLIMLLFVVDRAWSTNIPTAVFTIQGAEQTINGSYDTGTITVSFSGLSETVTYGQYSTPASIAAALAAKISSDPISALPQLCSKGICAKAHGASVTIQLNPSIFYGYFGVTRTGGGSFSVQENSWPPYNAIIALHCTPNPVALGSPAQCIATTSDPQTVNIDFSVDGFEFDGNDQVEVPVVNGTAVLTGYLADQAVGAHTITAWDDDNFLAYATYGITIRDPTASGASNLSPTTIYSYSIPSSGGYDTNNNILSYTDSINGQWSNITYDQLNRIKSANGAPADGTATQYMCWSYDLFGNRTTQVTSGSAISGGGGSACQASTGTNAWANYNLKNQVTGTPQLPVYPDNAYDAAGNQVLDGNNLYAYDAEGRLCASLSNGFLTQYIYDAKGRRVAKGASSSAGGSLSCDTSSGFVASSTYGLDLAGSPMTEYDSTGAWASTDIHTAGELIASYRNDNQGVHFHVGDWLGTRRVQTNYQGVVEMSYTNAPFGDITSAIPSPTCQVANGCSPQDSSTKHFTGKERDVESGLDYFGTRYYGSSIGRFSSPDNGIDQHVGDPQSWNLYTYVRNNPLRATDPTGMMPCATANGGSVNLASQSLCNSWNGRDGDDNGNGSNEAAQKEDAARKQQQAQRTNSATTTVTLNNRQANIPGGRVLDAMGIDHQWISTPDGTAVGMGTAQGVPQSDAPGVQTQVVDHTGEVATSTQTFTGVDKAALGTYIKVGTPTGRWIPSVNDCNTWAYNVIHQSTPHDIYDREPVVTRNGVIPGHIEYHNVVVYADGSIHSPGGQQ